MSTATHEEILDRVAAAAPAARSKITGPIAQINIGPCNFANLTEGRVGHKFTTYSLANNQSLESWRVFEVDQMIVS